MSINLNNLLSDVAIRNTVKVLLILYSEDRELSVSEIKDVARKNGLREAENWNIAGILQRLKSKGLVANLSNGWSIKIKGKAHIDNLGLVSVASAHNAQVTPSQHMSGIKNVIVEKLAEETITALGYKPWVKVIILVGSVILSGVALQNYQIITLKLFFYF